MGFFPASFRDSLTPLPSEDEQPLPFFEGVGAAYEHNELVNSSLGLGRQVEQGTRQALQGLADVRGEGKVEFPVGPWSNHDVDAQRAAHAAADEEILAYRKQHDGGGMGPPDLHIQTSTEVQKDAEARVAATGALAERAGIGGAFVGSMGSMVTDPPNLLAMVAASGYGETLLLRSLTEAGANVFGQAVSDSVSLRAKENVGLTPTVGEEAQNLAFAAGFGGLMGGTFHGLHAAGVKLGLLNEYESRVAGGMKPTAEQQAAHDAIRDLLDTVPPGHSPEAENAHLRAVAAGADAVMAEGTSLEHGAAQRLQAAVAEATGREALLLDQLHLAQGAADSLEEVRATNFARDVAAPGLSERLGAEVRFERIADPEMGTGARLTGPDGRSIEVWDNEGLPAARAKLDAATDALGVQRVNRSRRELQAVELDSIRKQRAVAAKITEAARHNTTRLHPDGVGAPDGLPFKNKKLAAGWAERNGLRGYRLAEVEGGVRIVERPPSHPAAPVHAAPAARPPLTPQGREVVAAMLKRAFPTNDAQQVRDMVEVLSRLAHAAGTARGLTADQVIRGLEIRASAAADIGEAALLQATERTVAREAYLELGRNAAKPPKQWVEAVEQRTGRKVRNPEALWESARTPLPPRGTIPNEFFAGPSTERFRERVGVRAEGLPENPDVTFESAPVDGRRLLWAFGDKTPEQWVAEQVANLSRPEIKLFKVWYENVVKLFKDNGYTEREAVAWAANNVNQSTDTALGGVFKVMDQNAGYPVPEGTGAAAGLGDANVRAVLSGGKGTFGPGAKIPDFADSTLGRKTRTFMGDDATGGEPFVADLHTTTDRGHISGVILAKLADAEGPWAKGKLNGVQIAGVEVTATTTTEVKGKSITQPSELVVRLEDGTTVTLKDDTAKGQPKNYEAVADWGQRVTQYLNRTKALGRDKWSAWQVQAVGWMNVLRRRGEALQTPDWFFRRQKSTHAHELAWGDGSRLSKVYPALSSLNPKAAAQITFDVIDKAARDLAETLGGSIRVVSTTLSHGFWGGDVNPNVVITTAGSQELRSLLGDALSLVGEQGGVFSVAFDRGARMGAFLRHADGSPLSVEEVGAFLDFAVKQDVRVGAPRQQGGGKMLADHIGGASYLEVDGGNAHFVGDMSPAQAEKLKAAFAAWGEETGTDVRHDSIKHEQTYYTHDWNADPEGGVYRRRLEDRGRTGLAGDVDAYRAAYAGHIEDAFAKHAPGLLDQEGRADRVARASGASPTALAQREGQTIRGALEWQQAADRAILHLTQDANVTTPIHEFAHWFRRLLEPSDLRIAEEWLGVEAGDWTRLHEEKFAEGFTKYMAEGVAPVPKLEGLFVRFKKWISEIAGRLYATDVELTPAARDLFDRVLTLDQEQPAVRDAVARIEGKAEVRARLEAAIDAERQNPTPAVEARDPYDPKAPIPHVSPELDAAVTAALEADPELTGHYTGDDGQVVEGGVREVMDKLEAEAVELRAFVDCMNGVGIGGAE